MPTTNVPLPTFTPTGLLTPDAQAVLTGVLADYVAAFAMSGKTLSMELTTPQGQLASAQSEIVTEVQSLLKQLIANVDPLTSSGSFQDALGRIYFLTRKSATFATVVAILGGIPNTSFASGALQAQSSDGTIWVNTGTVTLNNSGAATGVVFQATTAGPTPIAAINDLRIYQQVSGWQTITNPAQSSPGTATETPQEFETRRSESVQIGGVGTAEAVRAAVANVANVTDVYVYNNGTDAAITYGATSYPIPAHSIAVCVSGGTDADVANAIHSKLDAGCGMSTSETTTYTITDSVNYVAPYPQYPIRFVRAIATPVYITVNVANVTTLPADYVAKVQQVVAATFASGYRSADGTINLSRARIGGQVIAGEFLTPVQALGNITPVTAYIGFSAAPVSGAAVTLGIDQQPVCPALNITVNAVTV